MNPSDPSPLLRPCRKINGISAILLPFTDSGDVDWASFTAHVARTADCGLTPAVNMDTGYVNLLDHQTQNEVLRQTRSTLGNRPFVAGAFVSDSEGDAFRVERYAERISAIQAADGFPIIFQSHGLVHLPGPEIVARYQQIAQHCDRFLAFELTQDLAPFGAIYDIDTFSGLMSIPQCVGLKHSSFRREPEWERLMRRNAERPDFIVYTGNDFAIDMVMYGSDYLLGLSTFAPDLFAKRDGYWAHGDPRFYELNDVLQYLGCFAFRRPSPGYKHSAAQFLKLRGWVQTDRTHPMSKTRPPGDVEILKEMAEQLHAISI